MSSKYSPAKQKKPTIIFVPGAFHTAASFSLLYPLLQSQGYPCITDLNLPSTGGPSVGAKGLADDAECVRSLALSILDGTGRLQSDGPNDVVVVMHSGGAAGSQGLAGLGKKSRGEGTTAVRCLIFICASMPQVGESHAGHISKWAEKHPELPNRQEFLKQDGENVLWAGPDDLFYSDLPPETRKSLAAQLLPQAMGAMTTPLTAAAYKEIPSWYLITAEDRTFWPEFQEWVCETQKDYIQHVEKVQAGHSPFISKPETVADFIVRADEAVGG